VIYEPKSKYHEGDKSPPKINTGFFSWVHPLIHVKEPELLDKIGLDAVAFLRKRSMKLNYVVLNFEQVSCVCSVGPLLEWQLLLSSVWVCSTMSITSRMFPRKNAIF
jgi:hypothetical protein